MYKFLIDCFKRRLIKLEYESELYAGKVKTVYGNSIIDVETPDGRCESAFCGAVEVMDLCQEGTPVLLLAPNSDNRIIKYNVLFIKTLSGWVFADPKYNRALFKEAFVGKRMPDLSAYKGCRPLKATEAKGIDFELTTAEGKKAFVYVTSIYYKKGEYATFPQKMNFFEIEMLEEMKHKKESGADAFILLIAPREDCIKAKFVWDIDPAAAAAMYDAKQAGVNFVCYGCQITDNGIKLDNKMEISY